MRTTHRPLVAIAALFAVACSTGDDTSTVIPAVPLALSADSVAGVWRGESLAESIDSVTARWTAIGIAAGDGQFVMDGTTDTVATTTAFDADSMVITSAPYAEMVGAAPVIQRSVARRAGDMLMGTFELHLATRPDSLIRRGRFVARRE